jgi:hypothetical protein
LLNLEQAKVVFMKDHETATYICDMILELRNLAKGAKFLTLQGLLEISYYEAFSVANPVHIPIDEAQRLEVLASDARRFAAA